MPEAKSNLKNIRAAAVMHGIFSIAELARKARCSRTCIYAFASHPKKLRISKAHKRLKALIDV